MFVFIYTDAALVQQRQADCGVQRPLSQLCVFRMSYTHRGFLNVPYCRGECDVIDGCDRRLKLITVMQTSSSRRGA